MTQTENINANGTSLRSAAFWFGVIGVVASILWGGWALWHLSDDFGAMERTQIPGEVTFEIDEPGEKVVYYERDTLVATPVDPDIEVSVSGPDGNQVTSEPTTRVQYRVFQTVRQPHLTFPATEEGTYTVTAGGRPADDGATIAVGPRIGLSSLSTLSGPIVALLASIVVLAWGGVMRWGSRASSDSSPVR